MILVSTQQDSNFRILIATKPIKEYCFEDNTESLRPQRPSLRTHLQIALYC